MQRKGIDTYCIQDFERLVDQAGQKRFRADQLLTWLYKKGIHDYNEAHNLPESMRTWLTDNAPLFFPHVVDRQVSVDGTRKYILELHDGNFVETVGIPSQHTADRYKRLTVCFSTQVGCAMGCAFCATGQEGFTRNLSPGEMIQQILVVQQDFEMRVSNVVAMGQGEPFLNYDNLLAALRIMNHPKYLQIGARHISVSTCGIVDGIQKFSSEPEQFVLAISLHSAIQKTRDILMPRVSATPLTALRKALEDYQKATARRISFEYLLIADTNDTLEHLDALVEFCAGLSSHVNLLPLNSIGDSIFKPSKKDTVDNWLKTLERAGVQTSLRLSRGSDVCGACGQLKNLRAL